MRCRRHGLASRGAATTPSNSEGNLFFTLNSVTFVFTQTGENDVPVAGSLSAYTASFFGGRQFDLNVDGRVFFNVSAAVIFSGNTSAPTFTTGTYSSGNTPATMSLSSSTIAETPSTTVPEPSTALLMASGLAALGVMARRRRRA